MSKHWKAARRRIESLAKQMGLPIAGDPFKAGNEADASLLLGHRFTQGWLPQGLARNAMDHITYFREESGEIAAMLSEPYKPLTPDVMDEVSRFCENYMLLSRSHEDFECWNPGECAALLFFNEKKSPFHPDFCRAYDLPLPKLDELDIEELDLSGNPDLKALNVNVDHLAEKCRWEIKSHAQHIQRRALEMLGLGCGDAEGILEAVGPLVGVQSGPRGGSISG